MIRTQRITRIAGWTSCIVVAGLLAVAPALVGRGTLAFLLTLLLYAALAQSWNLVGGFAGLMSLGHAAFLGAGAYTTAAVLLGSGLPIALALALSGAVGALFALVTSVGLLRLRGVYFVIATLAVALATQSWMVNWESTGGSRGLNLPFADLPDPVAIYYLALVLAAAVSAVAWWLSWSAFGLRVMAVRDDEEAANALGVDGVRIKVAAFTLSGGFTGMVGAVVALNQIALVPDNLFGMTWTINMVMMTIIGGLGSVAGPPVGAIVVYGLIDKQLESQPDLGALIAGALVIFVIRFAPGGIVGLVRQTMVRLFVRARRTADGELPPR